MRNIICILFFMSGFAIFSQAENHIYTDTKLKAEYYTKNGMMDGRYTSYYANGKKKAEGHFKNNLRTGKWTVWDSTCAIRFEYTVPLDGVKRNTDGYFDFIPLKETDVLLEKRTWRNIYPGNNGILFNRIDLFDSLYKEIQNENISVFKDDEYRNQIKKEDIRKNFSSEKYKIVSFKIKEDWFLDKKTGASRSQVIGICPILKPMKSGSEANIELGWLYYPQLRKYLAELKIANKETVPANLDDVFYFNYFHSQIYKETNVYDRPIADYEKTENGIAREAERIELCMIEMEHDFWIHSQKP